MANEEQLGILKQGVEVWNEWRTNNPAIEAFLNGSHLRGADLNEADLRGAKLNRANLHRAKLIRADLRNADLVGADLSGAVLSGADLSGAFLNGADLSEAFLNGADLRGADLRYTTLVSTNFTSANLFGCRIYGISAWDVKLDGAIQTNLDISGTNSPLTVDNLEVAQFVYMLIHNEKIRDVIQTIGNKAVLVLGRFADEKRKAVLDALRDKLREEKLLPIVFDFEKATDRDFTETIKILAGMSLFVIVDITAPRSVPLELQATVPDYMIPFVPIIEKGEQPFSMFVNLQNKYSWVMDVLAYETKEQLIEYMPSRIIKPALEKHNELIALKNQALRYKDISAE